MSTRIEFTVPAEACALGRSLGGEPGARIELDRIVPTDDTIMPFFWVYGRSPEAFTKSARTESAVESISVVDRIESGTLFSARWNRKEAGTLFAIARSGGTLLDAHATTERWRFEVRFVDRAATGEFRQFCADREVPLSIQRVTTAPLRESDRYGLTDEQREALAVAYQRGYFEEPRRATLEDVASDIGISSRALAGRLRRGQATLLERTDLAGSA
ncbi:MAG: helix-turn-helix domain-containing protein [Halalkalicoccus sp.]